MMENNMTPQELYNRGIEALTKELGPYGMARFLNQVESGQGDYTEDRKAWLDNVDPEELLRSLDQ